MFFLTYYSNSAGQPRSFANLGVEVACGSGDLVLTVLFGWIAWSNFHQQKVTFYRQRILCKFTFCWWSFYGWSFFFQVWDRSKGVSEILRIFLAVLGTTLGCGRLSPLILCFGWTPDWIWFSRWSPDFLGNRHHPTIINPANCQIDKSQSPISAMMRKVVGVYRVDL